MYEYICLLRTQAFPKRCGEHLASQKEESEKQQARSTRLEWWGRTQSASREWSRERKNRELVRVRVNTQEVERNIRLRLVFPLTLLSCSSPPPACFTTEQSIVKVSLFVNFHIVCSTVLRTFFLLSTPSIIKFWNTIRELITSSNTGP